MLSVSSQRLLALFRILVTLQCCWLVLFSNRVDVSNCVVLLDVLIRYQRNLRSVQNIVIKKRYQVSKEIRCQILPIPSMVESILLPPLCSNVGLCDLCVTNVWKQNSFVIDYMWYVRNCSKIFIHLEKLCPLYLGRHTIGSKLYDEYNFAFLYHNVILLFENATSDASLPIDFERSAKDCINRRRWV